jgi:hypothetical protein
LSHRSRCVLHERTRFDRALRQRPGTPEQVSHRPPAEPTARERSRRLRLGLVRRERQQVILEVLADARQLVARLDPGGAELGTVADARQHEHVRRADRATAHDHLARLDQLVASAHADVHTGDAIAVEHQAERERVADDREVVSTARRLEEHRRGAAAEAVLHVGLIEAGAFLLGAVEVVGDGDLAMRRARLDERARGRLKLRRIADRKQAVAAVKLRGAAHVGLGALEVRQHVGVAPARIAELFPLVVVVAVAADVDERVEAAGAADHLAARPVHLAIVDVRLRLRVELPVERAPPQRLVHARRADLERAVLRRAGLDQDDLARGLLREPMREHAARGPCTDDRDIEHGPILRTGSPRV